MAEQFENSNEIINEKPVVFKKTEKSEIDGKADKQQQFPFYRLVFFMNNNSSGIINCGAEKYEG
jgi:hypothetical protein